MNTPSASLSTILESLFNHVALPPQLPGKEENRIEQIEHALTVRLLDASRTFRDLTNDEFSNQWDCIRRSLQICKVVNAGGKINKSSLVTEFRSLERKDLLILHIAEQNAGLTIRRHSGCATQTQLAVRIIYMADILLFSKCARRKRHLRGI